MTDHQCPRCARRFRLEPRHIVSAHHTSEGVLAYVRCPAGHLDVIPFPARSASIT